MGRLLPNHPILRFCIIGLIIVFLWGSAFFLDKKYLSWWSTDSTKTIRQSFSEKENHPLGEREKTVSSRPIRQETLLVNIDIWLRTPLLTADKSMVIPVFSWSIQALQTVWIGNTIGSWTIVGSGAFIANDTLAENSWDKEKNLHLINLSFQTHFIWSWTTTWWYLDTITVQQSWATNEFLLVARSYLKAYEKTRIKQENTPQDVRSLQTLPLFQLLTEQTDQHLISSASWTTQILIDGKERWVDAVVSSLGKVTAKIRFPEFWVRALLQQNTHEWYEFSLTHYLVSWPVLWWSISFIPERRQLKSTWTRSWSRQENLFYRWSHTFIISPIPLFTIPPPEQYRNREDITSLWTEHKK